MKDDGDNYYGSQNRIPEYRIRKALIPVVNAIAFGMDNLQPASIERADKHTVVDSRCL